MNVSQMKEIERRMKRLINKCVRDGFGEDEIAKGLATSEVQLREIIERAMQSKAFIDELGFEKEGRPRTKPVKAEPKRVVAVNAPRAPKQKVKGRRAMKIAPALVYEAMDDLMNEAMDDINGGGEDDPAQFSNDNERADIE